MATRNRHLLILAVMAVGMLATRDPLAETRQFQYRYDSAGRLIEERTADAVVSYQYDAAGTIVQRQSAPNPVLFADGFEESP